MPVGHLVATLCFLAHRYGQHSGLVDIGGLLLSAVFEGSYLYFGHKLSAAFVVNAAHKVLTFISSCSVCFYLDILEARHLCCYHH